MVQHGTTRTHPPLPRWRYSRDGWRGARGGRDGGSCAHFCRPEGDPLPRGCDARVEGRFVPVDSRSAPGISKRCGSICCARRSTTVGTTFQEEYVRLLRKGLVEYDDRYLW